MARIYAANDPAISQREMRNAQRSRQIAAQGMVLLKNNGALPIRKTGKIALYGKGGRMTVKGGTGSGDVNCRNVISVEQGLERAGFEVLAKDWLDAYDDVWKQYEQQRTAKCGKKQRSERITPLGLLVYPGNFLFKLAGFYNDHNKRDQYRQHNRRAKRNA